MTEENILHTMNNRSVTTSVTDRFLDAARTDANTLHVQRVSIETEMQELVHRMNELRPQLDEIIELQSITLARITQYEKAKING